MVPDVKMYGLNTSAFFLLRDQKYNNYAVVYYDYIRVFMLALFKKNVKTIITVLICTLSYIFLVKQRNVVEHIPMSFVI